MAESRTGVPPSAATVNGSSAGRRARYCPDRTGRAPNIPRPDVGCVRCWTSPRGRPDEVVLLPRDPSFGIRGQTLRRLGFRPSGPEHTATEEVRPFQVESLDVSTLVALCSMVTLSEVANDRIEHMPSVADSAVARVVALSARLSKPRPVRHQGPTRR